MASPYLKGAPASGRGISDIAGRLTVTIKYTGQVIQDVQITSTRPKQLTSLFEGKSPQEVTVLVPLFFSLCSTAQSVACLSAIESLQGVKVSPQVLIARSVLIHLETARELCLRLSKDWLADWEVINLAKLMQHYQLAYSQLGGCLTLQTESAGVAVQTFDYDFLTAELDEILMPMSQFCFEGLDTHGSTNAMSVLMKAINQQFSGVQLGPSTTPLQVTPEYLKHKLEAQGGDEFCTQPEMELEGKWVRAETSIWTRNTNSPLIKQAQALGFHPLTLRLLALIYELATLSGKIRALHYGQISGQMRDQARGTESALITSLAPGLVKVQAARGDLIHKVILDKPAAGGCVQRYQIIAPTEWNFHPQGCLVSMLKGVTVSKESLLLLLDKLILAIDPCVAYDIQIEE